MGENQSKNKEVEIKVKVVKNKDKRGIDYSKIKMMEEKNSNDVVDRILKGDVGNSHVFVSVKKKDMNKSKARVEQGKCVNKSKANREKPVKNIKKIFSSAKVVADKGKIDKKPLSLEAKKFIMYVSVAVFVGLVFVGWIFSLKYNFKIINQNATDSGFGEFRESWQNDFGEVKGVFEDSLSLLETKLEDEFIEESPLVDNLQKELVKDVIIKDVKDQLEENY